MSRPRVGGWAHSECDKKSAGVCRWGPLRDGLVWVRFFCQFCRVASGMCHLLSDKRPGPGAGATPLVLGGTDASRAQLWCAGVARAPGRGGRKGVAPRARCGGSCRCRVCGHIGQRSRMVSCHQGLMGFERRVVVQGCRAGVVQWYIHGVSDREQPGPAGGRPRLWVCAVRCKQRLPMSPRGARRGW